MKNLIIILMPAFLLIAGCEKKFLDVDQPGVITISATQDYDLLLNSDDITTITDWPLLCLSDNFEFDPVSAPSGASLQIYTWQDQPYQDTDPVLWSAPYKAIYYSNLVINEVDNSSGGTRAEKDKLKGEAYLSRAFMHFLLLQIFAKPYSSSSSDKDPGIPYVTVADMYSKSPERSTVKQTYDKILSDLDKALPLLPPVNNANYRGSKAAAYGLLARIYLHLRDYDKVVSNADLMLDLRNTVLDYSPATFTLPTEINNQENVYLRMVFEFDHPFNAFLTQSGENSLTATDSRRRLYVSSAIGYQKLFSMLGLSVPEILLTKAEALTRKSVPDLTSALSIVNSLNAKRDRIHTDLTSSNEEQVLNWVLNERRRELIASGLRWLDMRRLAAEGRMPVITRAVGADTFTLTPDSKKYTLQIPGSVISFNKGMQQNN